MPKQKFYAVKKGKKPGIYLTWAACKSQVDGFSGAIYKSFLTKEEAERYMGMVQGGLNLSDTQSLPDLSGENAAAAYVDGSYNAASRAYSCGVVFLYQGEELHFCKLGEDKELASMRNVAGELLGARLAMEEAVKRNISALTIYHDYQGIASWCLGEWKTNKEGTKAYKAYYDSLQDKIQITFCKVKGHSGDKYNDLADELAKSVIFP